MNDQIRFVLFFWLYLKKRKSRDDPIVSGGLTADMDELRARVQMQQKKSSINT